MDTVNQANVERSPVDKALLAKYKKLLASMGIPKDEHKVLAQLLAYYQIPLDQAKNFLNPTEEKSLPEPFALKDMRPATDLVLDSIKQGKKFAVWADYDADGNTSAAMLGHVLETIGAKDPILTIPYRTEGFGLNIPGIRRLHEQGVEVLVVADSGTVAIEQIAEAKRLGMEVIVLDHHHSHLEELPDALVVNPNRPDETSPHGALAAASVSYVFARDLALNLRERKENDVADKLDFRRLRAISAIGVVADVVSLGNSANRYIVKEGLEAINSRDFPGINVLKDLFGESLNRNEITAEDLAFIFGPSINAAGRLGDPMLGMRILMAKTEEEAIPIAKKLKAVNEERKIITEQVFKEADARAQEYLARNPGASFLMLEDEKWHYGVVGIVAGRLKEKYDLPVAVGHSFTTDKGEKHTTYSARSIENVNFFKSVVAPLIDEKVGGVIKTGGHAMAAGITIQTNQRDAIQTYIDDNLQEPVKKAHNEKTLRYLDVLPLKALQSAAFERAYGRMEPFGQMMRRPRYLIQNVQVKGLRLVGGDRSHIQFSLGDADDAATEKAVRGGVLFRGVGTPMGEVLTSPTRRDERMDMIVEPFVRKYKGESQVGFLPLDIANVERLGRITSPEELEAHSSQLLQDRDIAHEEEKAAIQNLPRKIRNLQDEANRDAQDSLKILYEAKVAVLDTETGGLEAGNEDISKANGLTQIAMITGMKRANGKYKAREYNQPILPVTPAFFGYKKASDANAALKKPKDLSYDRAAYEFDISPDALAVTGLAIKRESLQGPIAGMVVGHHTLNAKPFYEIAAGLAKMLMEHTAAAYNAPFDMPVLANHFSAVLDARVDHPEPRLRIPAEYWDQWQTEVRLPLQEALKVPKGTRALPIEEQPAGKEQLPKNLTNPAEYHCLMHGAMVHKGFSTSQRLQHIAPEKYGVAFEQDDAAHDALADVGPLVYMFADQYREFGNKKFTLTDLWQEILNRSGTKGEAIADENGDIILRMEKGEEPTPALAEFFREFKEVSSRNPRTKAYVGVRSITSSEEAGSKTVTLMGREKSRKEMKRTGEIRIEYYKQPRHVSLVRKTLCRGDIESLSAAVKAHPFTSTSYFDITLLDAAGQEAIIEDVPIGSLAPSMTFLKAHPELLEQNLQLIKTLNSEKRVGRVIIEEDGVTIKGQNGHFGEVKFLVPLAAPNLDIAAIADSITSHLDFLMKVGGIPGVHSTTRELSSAFGDEVEADAEEVEGKRKAVEPLTYVQLGKMRSMLMEVRKDLFEAVASQMEVDLENMPAQMPGGAIVHFDDGQGVYLIEGTVENFHEINMPLRDASWLLHHLNTLPGIYSGDTEITRDSVKLVFRDGVPMDVLEILEKSHIPFRAEQTFITVPLDGMMNDPYHWSQQLSKEKQASKNNQNRATPTPPLAHIQELHKALMADTLQHYEYGRDGNFWVADRKYQFLPFDWRDPLIVADKDNNIDLDESHILAIPEIRKIQHPGLRGQLSKIAGMERLATPDIRTRLNRITIEAPTIEALKNPTYSADLRTMAEHVQSVHISPLLDELRDILASDEMQVPHHDDEQKYMEQVAKLVEKIEANETLIDQFNEELNTILDKEVESRFEHGIHSVFDDIAALLVMEHTLKSQQKRGNISATDKGIKAITETVREYADALEKLEFKRERVREGCVDVQKRMIGFTEGQTSRAESVAKAVASYHMLAMRKATTVDEALEHEANARHWLEKIYPVDRARFEDLVTEDPAPEEPVAKGAFTVKVDPVGEIIEKNQKKIDETIEAAAEASQDEPHEALQVLRQVSGGISSLWDETQSLNRTFILSRDLIESAVALDQEDKRALVQQATSTLLATGTSNVLSTLKILEKEGAVRDVRMIGEAKVSFDATNMLKDPERWSKRLADLSSGKKPGPDAPYVLYDTSTLLTLLLATEPVRQYNGLGMLSFIQDLAELDVETPVLTDMVLAEFLDSPAPLTPEDIFNFDQNGKATSFRYQPQYMSHTRSGVQISYPNAIQRLEFLKELYNSGKAHFLETRTAEDYLSTIRQSEELQRTLSQHAPSIHSLVSMSDGQLKALLLDHDAPYFTAMQKRIRTLHLRNDAGEVSIADGMQQLRDIHGSALPIFVRFEGSDVRGRIIQRLHEPETTHRSPLNKRYSPHNPRDVENKSTDFDRSTLDILGNGGFQSTGGMFMSLARMLHQSGGYVLDPRELQANYTDDGRFQWEPRTDAETGSGSNVQLSYEYMLQNVGFSLGSERAYSAIKDVAFADTEYNVKSENEPATGKPSPLHDHLMKQPHAVQHEIAKRHMERLSEYLSVLALKWEDHARNLRHQIGHVDACLDTIGKRLALSQTSEQDLRAAIPFTSRISAPTATSGSWQEIVTAGREEDPEKRAAKGK